MIHDVVTKQTVYNVRGEAFVVSEEEIRAADVGRVFMTDARPIDGDCGFRTDGAVLMRADLVEVLSYEGEEAVHAIIITELFHSFEPGDPVCPSESHPDMETFDPYWMVSINNGQIVNRMMHDALTAIGLSLAETDEEPLVIMDGNEKVGLLMPLSMRWEEW